MQVCEKFEDRLIDYTDLSRRDRADVDAHLAVCGACRDYFEVLDELDSRLVRQYSGVESPLQVEEQVRRAMQSPRGPLTMLPEVLDFAGWTAVVIALAALTFVVPLPALPPEVLSYRALPLVAAAVVGAAWAGLRSYAEMRN